MSFFLNCLKAIPLLVGVVVFVSLLFWQHFPDGVPIPEPDEPDFYIWLLLSLALIVGGGIWMWKAYKGVK